jgi:hypothetical protein
MLASSVEHGLCAGSCEAVPAIRSLSPSIAFKRNLLAVNLTVSLHYREKKSRRFRYLEVPETIEWE